MKEPSYLQIDLGRVEENIKALSALCTVNGHTPLLCAVVKKNAYGLGAVPVGARASKAGCSMLGVYSACEASEIITAGITAPVLLLGPLEDLKRTDPLYRAAISGQLHVSIHQPQELENINRIGHAFATRINVHLYIDSGMSRGGLTAEQFTELVSKLSNYQHINLVGIYSHIACAADNQDFTLRQLDIYTKALEQAHLDSHLKQSQANSRIIKHIANTYATLGDPALHLDMVRPGLGILGYGTKTRTNSNIALKPALRWKSKIVHIQRYRRNTPVGYGSMHTLRRDSFLGVVPAGYGDGYPLALSDKAQVLIELQDSNQPAEQYIVSAAVVGQVNMDQIVIDLTDAAKAFGFDPENGALVNSAGHFPNWLGATVELIGDDPQAPNALENLARLAGSHCHEMLCRLSSRLSRHYTQ